MSRGSSYKFLEGPSFRENMRKYRRYFSRYRNCLFIIAMRSIIITAIMQSL